MTNRYYQTTLRFPQLEIISIPRLPDRSSYLFTAMLLFGNLKSESKGGITVNGKTVISIIIAVTIIGIILTWFWLQDVIQEYDLDTSLQAEHTIEINNINHMNTDYLSLRRF